MELLVLDAKSPSPYDGSASRVGGSEQCVIAVTRAIGDEHEVTVTVAKLPWGTSREIDGVRWRGPGWGSLRALRRADVVIVQRRPELLPLVRLLNAQALVFCWYHDLVYTSGGPFRARAGNLAKAYVRGLAHALTRASAVVVSDFHRENLAVHLAVTGRLARAIRIDVAYNPVVQDGPPLHGPVDRDQLIYMSAAWKGLEQVLRTFSAMRESIPSLRLLVATPGYTADADPSAAGVEFVGSLPKDALLARVASSLCVFYPADRVPETFGLVFAEAHGVGTPVLAHPFGAALEMLSKEELVSATDQREILARLRDWRDGARPEVGPDPRFTIEAVRSTWLRLLDDRPDLGSSSPEPGTSRRSA